MDNYWELTKSLPNERNQIVINDFLLSLKILNHSKGTVIQYRRFLESFFIDKRLPFSEISSESIHDWFITNQHHVKDVTLRTRISIVSSFYSFCVQEGFMESTPIKSRWYPRLPKPIPKYLEKAEVAKTIQQTEKGSIRNRVMVEFMLSSGCRVGELYQLNRKDIVMENRTAHVMGKGNKIRQVHFSEKCAVLLERYLASHPKQTEALFITSKGKRLGIRGIQLIVKKVGENAGLHSNLHPHRFRHTFATELLSKGAELSFISEELGHTSLNTTQIYARLPKKEIISLYRRYMG